MIKKTTILTVMVLAIAFLGFTLVAFGLPKDGKPAASTSGASAQTPITARVAKPQPIPAEDFEYNLNVPQPPVHRGGATRVLSAGVPYVSVRTGTTETPGGNNHMRRQVKVSNAGVAHMVYGVFNSDTDYVVRTAVDSVDNGRYFYNAYDCGGSNALRNGSKDIKLQQSFTGIGDARPRVTLLGGMIMPNTASGVPVSYGFVQINNYPNSPLFQSRGWATLKDGAECLGLFSMDTSQTTGTTRQHPMMRPLNESTYVATFRAGNTPNAIAFSHTTDRGVTWSAANLIATYSPWFNSVEIASNGNTFYLVSHTDPADVAAFETTERPVYLRGDYNPVSGAITFGTMTDIPAQAGVTEVGFLAAMLDIGATMIGDTLVVAWMDWNNWLGQGIPGPGGHVHSARILPDGSVPGILKVADVNIAGTLPKMSTTAFGFAIFPWSQVELSYNSTTKNLYCLWSQPPPDSTLGVPNLAWGDYEATGNLGVFDILCSVSPNNGRGWDEPSNVTQTNNPGCTGVPGDECENEYWFSADDRIVNDTVWIIAQVQKYPGIQESAIASGIPPDVGPFTTLQDEYRLYKMPARAPVMTARGSLGPVPGDTLNPFAILLAPGAPVPFGASLRLQNIGLLGFLTDSIKIDAAFNDGFLVTTSNFNPGEFVNVAQGYDFQVLFNSQAVTPSSIGGRAGVVSVFIHTNAPATSGAIHQAFSVYIIPSLCLNRKVRIHSASNSTDVGSQGTIKDQGGNGMFYPLNGTDRFYDGGVWIANSSLQGAAGTVGVPRNVSRQIFSDKFLRCVSDVVLDSTAGAGYYNLYAVSVATDIEDSGIVYKNVWEQSTHADSSDFLLQSVKLININSTPIDSVAMGVIYDVDVQGASAASENVSGDTTVSYSGRTFWLGWQAGNDISIDTCSPNNEMYGVVVIPNGIGNPGDFIRPRGAVMYHQSGFSYGIGYGNDAGGDSLCERWSWYLNVVTSSSRRDYDTLTGVYGDTLGGPPLFVCDGDAANGRAYRDDQGYMTIAKKVYNLPTNQTGDLLVSRYGLDGLAAGMDSAFTGAGESYTIIHVASNNGLTDLMANAVKGIDWYSKHANYQVGPYQSVLRRGDFDNNSAMNPADVAGVLNFVFLALGQFPPCVGDVDLNGSVAASDAVTVLNKVFLDIGCPWCLVRCP